MPISTGATAGDYAFGRRPPAASGPRADNDHDISLYMLALSLKLLSGATEGLLSRKVGEAKHIYGMFEAWVKGYQELERYPGEGYGVFYSDWKKVRMWLSLQERLCVEQVLFDMGRPWRSLVTGFVPVGEAPSRSQP